MGRIAMRWAMVEDGIDALTILSFRWLGGKFALAPAPLPRAFRRKIQYLRRAYQTLPALSSWREDALLLLGRTVPLGLQRHRHLHAVGTPDPANRKVGFIKWAYREENFYTERFSAHVDQLNELADQIHGLAADWLILAHSAFRARFPDYFEKADREVAG